MQPQSGHRGHLEVGARHAGDGDVEAVIEVEFADGFAEHVAIGDDDASEGDRALGEDEVFIAALADNALELIEPRAGADDGEAVVAMDHGRIGRGVRFVAVAGAGDGDARFEPAGDGVKAHTFEVRVRDDERAAFEQLDLAAVLRGEVGGLARGIDAEDLFEQQQRADDADDRRRISDRVGERRQREPIRRDARQRAERLRAGAERRRVCRGARKNSEHRRRIESRQPADERRGRGTGNDDRRREHVHLHALLPQRREETGAKLQTDREDKQDQPEFLHEIERVMIDCLAKMPDENPGKQHAGRPEPNPAKFEAAQRHPHHTHERQHANGVRDRLGFVEFEEPAHAFAELTVPSPCSRVYQTLVLPASLRIVPSTSLL